MSQDHQNQPGKDNTSTRQSQTDSQEPLNSSVQPSEPEQAPARKSRVRRVASHLNPWTTTSLQAELDLQKQIYQHAKRNARIAWQQLRERGEVVEENSNSSLWAQLGITTEAELDSILLTWLKKRNFSLLVTVLCCILFLISLILGMPILANLVCLVLMAEGGVEYMKTSWYLYCLTNDTYISFWSFLRGKR